MMASKFRKRQKRLRKRDRARSREAAAVATQPQEPSQPIVVRLNGANILKSLEKRFDELLSPRTPEETLASVLISKK
jgi:hypothetical protein